MSINFIILQLTNIVITAIIISTCIALELMQQIPSIKYPYILSHMLLKLIKVTEQKVFVIFVTIEFGPGLVLTVHLVVVDLVHF